MQMKCARVSIIKYEFLCDTTKWLFAYIVSMQFNVLCVPAVNNAEYAFYLYDVWIFWQAQYLCIS